LLLALTGIACAALLLVKGLYPGGGHDYVTHYFYYLQAVIERGGLWPNAVWYHYYYDKGAGLFFLGMLTTDPLAPQLVTFTCLAAALLPLFLVLRRIAMGTAWPLVGIALFVFFYICTPGPNALFSGNGGWANFEKPHEINAAMIIAVVWATLEMLSCRGRMRLLWWYGAAAAIIGAVILDVTIAAYLGGLFALLALFCAMSRRIASMAFCIGLAAVAGLVFVATLILNQLTTGLADDQGLLVFWKFADIEKLAQQGTLPLVMMLHHDRQTMVAASVSLEVRDMLIFLTDSLRLDLVQPMILGGVFVAALAIFRRRLNRDIATAAMVLAAAVAAFLAVAVLAGRAQPVSFYRYSSFTTAIAIACGVLCWNSPSGEDAMARIARSPLVAVLILLSCIFRDAYPDLTRIALSRALHFAGGRYSIDTAYTSQYGPPPRRDWSAIHPGARGANAAVGAGTPIWSLHIHTYCMLPDCVVESYPSFLMTHHWDRVMFGTPDEAKATLHAEHLDYFLFSRDADIRDPLPLSPLFSADNIGRSLGIRWADGTTSLLTWLGPGIAPLDQAWIADYRRAIGRSGVQSFPYAELQRIFARLEATPHPWRTLRLPWQDD
jgi:hypothetical protein